MSSKEESWKERRRSQRWTKHWGTKDWRRTQKGRWRHDQNRERNNFKHGRFEWFKETFIRLWDYQGMERRKQDP